MKKNIGTIIAALVAVAAIIFGLVTNGQKGDLQKKFDDAAAKVTELTASLDTAKKDAEAALTQAKEEAAKTLEDEIAKVKDEAAQAAEAAVAQAKEEAGKTIEELQQKLNELQEAAQAAIQPEAPTEEVSAEEPAAEETPAAEEKAVMSYEDYVAAELDSEVTVEAYVQAKQSWWDNKATIYTQVEHGAYFIYNMAISQEDYDKLVPGTKIRVTGYKSEWSGEVEITDAAFEILEADPFIAAAEDVTALLASEDLIKHQNELVAVKGVTVEAYDESGAAFVYKNANDKTDDLYFKVSKDGAVYEFCVEFYLCGQDTDVYKAVEALNVGDVIDVEGFLYWYNGANPHITAVTVVTPAPVEEAPAEEAPVEAPADGQ